MFDSRTNEWIARLQAQGPRLVSFLLAALIVVDAGRVAYAFLMKPVKSPQPQVSAVPPRNVNRGVDAQSIVDSHLFGEAPVDTANQDPDNAPLSNANVVLAGVIATQDPKHGVAIVSEGGGVSKVYSVGDRVGGAALHSVYLDHVILDRGGALETVNLPRQSLGGGGRPVTPRQMGGGDARTAAAVQSIRRLVQQDPGILDQVMRTVPSYDNAAGKLRGFRAFPGKNRQIFGKLGLRSGDLVTAVNGAPLDDPQRAQEVFNTIQSSDHVTVTVERGGQKQDITLNIAQVATGAMQELEPGAGANPPPAAAPAGPPDLPREPDMPPPGMPPPDQPRPND